MSGKSEGAWGRQTVVSGDRHTLELVLSSEEFKMQHRV